MSDPYRDLYRDAVIHILRLQARALRRDVRLMRELHQLNQKVDRLMSQHDDLNAALDTANTKLDTLVADTQALIAAVQAGSQSGDFSDSLAKATALSAKIGTADDSVKAATPAQPAP